MSGTILPSLPPLADDHMVTVCARCHKRSCILARSYRLCCEKRRAEPATSSIVLTAGQLRELKLEHPSYWRAEAEDDPDMPKCIEDVTELARHDRDRARDKPEPGWTFEERAGLFAGYLTEQLGLDAEQCQVAIQEIWPEAAQALVNYRLAIGAEHVACSPKGNAPAPESPR